MTTATVVSVLTMRRTKMCALFDAMNVLFSIVNVGMIAALVYVLVMSTGGR